MSELFSGMFTFFLLLAWYLLKLGAFQVTTEVDCAIAGIILPCINGLVLSTPSLSLSLMLCFYFWYVVIEFLPTANGGYSGIYEAGLCWADDISLMAFASLACNLRHNWTEQPDTTYFANTENQDKYFFQILLSRWTFLLLVKYVWYFLVCIKLFLPLALSLAF